MGEMRFSLESVARLREMEQEKIEKELARIGQERTREKEIWTVLLRERDEAIGTIPDSFDDAGAGKRIAFYGWLAFAAERIERQRGIVDCLEARFEKMLQIWRKARTETEKVRILRNTFRGERRVMERRKEERSRDHWFAARRPANSDETFP